MKQKAPLRPLPFCFAPRNREAISGTQSRTPLLAFARKQGVTGQSEAAGAPRNEEVLMETLFRFDGLKVRARFNDSSTAEVIYSALPIESIVNRWGDEIYFEIPAKLPLEKGTLDLKVGDIGYWPEGTCLCLFFGKTPASIDKHPRPASEVSIVGTFQTSPDALRKVVSGTAVRVSKP